MKTNFKNATLLVLGVSWLLGAGVILFSGFKNKKEPDDTRPTTTRLNASLTKQEKEALKGMVVVQAGMFEKKLQGIGKQVNINSFAIDKDLVTVADFMEFVNSTGYKTEAEEFGNAAVFDFETQEWSLVEGAYYLFPRGPKFPQALPDHPVTQVSWNDARAFAKWKNKRLPTSYEWEWAAQSGGKNKTEYSWGNEFKQNNKLKANFWQGQFPTNNTVEDGYLTTSPVGAFGANELGLTDMGGNVWQWCADSIAPTPQEAAMDPSIRKVTKGGSFLCDPKVCHGFRIEGAASSTAETALFHTGFRCVKDL